MKSGGFCSDCGGRTRDYRAKRCKPCHVAHITWWTPTRIIAAIRAWASVHGETPRQIDWRQARPGTPSSATVDSVFGSWNNAIVAAGLEARPWRRRVAA